MSADRLPSIALLALSFTLAAFTLPAPASAITITGSAVADNTLLMYTAASEAPGMVVNYTGIFHCYSATPASVFHATGDRYLYIACFSDFSVGQGLLHDLRVNGNPVFSGNANWTVAPGDTALAACSGSFLSQANAIGAAIAARIPTMAFVPTSNGCANTPAGCYSIWGNFAPINPTARWSWFNSGGQVSGNAPFEPGFNHRELLVFRLDMFNFLATPGVRASWGEVKNTYR